MNDSSISNGMVVVGVRWLARIMALGLAGVILFIAIGQGFNPAMLTPRELALAVPLFATWVGLMLGWRWEGLGGALVVGGIASFYLIHFATTGLDHFPRGWFLPGLAVPGVMYLVCWLRELNAKARSGGAATKDRNH
jgi:hypothetical protein